MTNQEAYNKLQKERPIILKVMKSVADEHETALSLARRVVKRNDSPEIVELIGRAAVVIMLEKEPDRGESMSEINDNELPEWYQMLKRIFVELNAYDQSFYREMGAGNVLAQVRYAALREMEHETKNEVPETKSKVDESLWCQVCQCWQRRSGLKRWTGDDRLHFLCPGCDGDLLPVQRLG